MQGRIPFVLGCAVLGLSFGGRIASAAVITPVGTPTWTVTDTHLFSAPLGNPGNGYADYGPTSTTILAPPNHEPHPQLGVGPGAPHAGPYSNEFGTNIANAGYVEKTTFTASEWGGDLGIWFTQMVIPNGSSTGSSTDFASGPILPNNLFPLTFYAETYRNGALYDITGTFTVPALNDPSLTPSFPVDGASHYPFFLVDNASFAIDPSLPVTGVYEYCLTLRDARGNGYDLTQSFTVVPDGTPGTVPVPPALWGGLLTAMLGVVPAARRLRAR